MEPRKDSKERKEGGQKREGGMNRKSIIEGEGERREER
jgi:hypothetical protein